MLKSTRRWSLLAATLFGVECLIATLWRRVPFVRADLGDYLVVIFLYAGAKSFKPFRATPLALGIFAFGVLIECAQGAGLADRLGFQRGSVPSIVLGTTFGWSDLLMYAAGCATAWLIDRPGRSSAKRLTETDDEAAIE